MFSRRPGLLISCHACHRHEEVHTCYKSTNMTSAQDITTRPMVISKDQVMKKDLLIDDQTGCLHSLDK